MDTDTRDRQTTNDGSHDSVDLSPHERAVFDQLQANYHNPSSQDDLQERESNPESSNNSSWADNTKRQSDDGTQGFFRLNRRRKGIVGTIVGFGILGGVFGGFLGPSTMFTSLMQNSTIKNSASSTAFERRMAKVFGELFKGSGDPDLVCGAKTKLSCKKGRLSNRALRQLSRKGITAVDGKNKPIKLSMSERYLGKDVKVSAYRVDMGNGKKPAYVKPDQMAGFLRQPENKKIAGKIFGRGSPFNPRVTTKIGSYISKKFYNKFNIKGKGGLFDGVKKRYSNAKERLAAAREKYKAKVPGLNKFNLSVDRLTKGRSSKSVAYTIAFMSCVAVKAGSFVASAVAATELARLLPVISETVLEPGSKLSASGVDTENPVSPEEIELAGALLTEKTPNSEGKMTSALDSKYLQAAIGINKNPVNPSERYTPGFGVMSNSFIKSAIAAEEASADACGFILSPLGYATFVTAEAVITRTNPIGAVAGLVAGPLVYKAAEKILGGVVKWVGEKAIDLFVSADFLPEAKGEDLGDALGIAAMAYFSAEDMSHNLNALEKDQISSFNKIRQESEEFQRQMDIASLSPFDTSSPYTFLGNIVNRLQVATIASGSYNNNFFQSLAQIARLPLRVFSIASTNISAADLDEAYCSHGSDNVARNASLLPCHWMSREQINMSTNNAMIHLQQAGWIDMEAEFDDDATLDELVSNDVITEDSPLDAFLNGETCDDASTGEYVFGAEGCTIQSDIESGSIEISGGMSVSDRCKGADSEGETIDECDGKPRSTGYERTLSQEDKAFLAMSVFAVDFQLINAINETAVGDESTGSDSRLSENNGKLTIDGWSYPLESGNMTTYANHIGMDMPTPVGTKVYAIREGTVYKTETMPAAQVYSYCKDILGAGFYPKDQNNIFIESNVEGVRYMHRYAHLSKWNVSEGDTVEAGDLIAWSGNTGCSSGPHLHLDISVPLQSGIACDLKQGQMCYIMLDKFLDKTW